MRDISTGSTPATAASIIIEELWSKGRWARGTGTPTAPASTTTIRTERWKAAVPATSESSSGVARRVHSSIFKITGGSSRRTIVGQTRAVVGHTGAVSVMG